MTAIAHSELAGKLVLNRQTTETLGTVEQFWLDPPTHQVAGLICQSGLLNRQRQWIPWSCIDTIGNDSVLIHSGTAPAGEPPAKSALIVGHELWTDGGDRAGKLVDFVFDKATGAVSDYLFITGHWRGPLSTLYRLPPVALSRVGEQRAIALAAAVAQAEPYQPGLALSRRLQAAKEFLQDDLEQTKQHLTAVLDEAQTATSQIRERLPEFSQSDTASAPATDEVASAPVTDTATDAVPEEEP